MIWIVETVSAEDIEGILSENRPDAVQVVPARGEHMLIMGFDIDHDDQPKQVLRMTSTTLRQQLISSNKPPAA